MNAVLHVAFEAASYTLGFGLFRWLRRREGHPADHPDGGWVLVGAILGAAAGSKLLDIAQYASFIAQHWREPAVVLAGKTIVGGLVGGWIGVEWAKVKVGITRSTGDLLVWPLCLGIALGRLGCLFAGPGDHTSGHLTDVSWAIDLGDGPRHPTQLYEVLALGVLALAHLVPGRDGQRFNRFIFGYLLFRFLVDYLKAPWGPDPLEPVPVHFFVTPIQAVALGGACYALVRLWRNR